mgnify:CR=1 FL=1
MPRFGGEDAVVGRPGGGGDPAARGQAQRFGGSHAQRDLIDQTLLSAAARGTRRGIDRALINERLMGKPATPLTQHWRAQLDLRTGAAA